VAAKVINRKRLKGINNKLRKIYIIIRK